MVKKRILAILVCVLMVMGNLSFLQKEAKAAGDTTPPQLISISIDKTSVTAGESVKIRAEVTDNGGSGVKEVSVYYLSPIKSIKVVLSKTAEGVFEGTFTLSKFEVSGVWKITYVYMLDMSYNPVIIHNAAITSYTPNMDFSSCNFNLSGTTADNTAPVLQSISVDKTSAAVGDSVKVRVEASDNGGSGLGAVYLYYRSPGVPSRKEVNLTEIQEGIYEGTVTFTSSDASGSWRIDSVYLSDIMYNSVTIYNSNLYTLQPNQDLSSGDINLAVDVISPSLKSISIDKTIVALGDSVKVRAEVIDNSGLGINNIVVNYMPVAQSYGFKSVNLEKVQEGVYEGTLTLNDISQIGLWKISHVSMKDMAGNYKTVFNSNEYPEMPNQVMSNCDFYLTDGGPIPDITPPVFKSVSVDKISTMHGYYVKVTVNAVDNGDSGINGIIIAYRISNSYNSINVGMSKVQEGVYEASIYCNDDSFLGLWQIEYIKLFDNAGNKAVVYNSNINQSSPSMDLSGGNFEFVEPKPVTGITLDKSELTINLGQTAQLNAAVTPEDAFYKQVNWSSSDPNVVEVDSTGYITALEKGTAVISASSYDGRYTAECTVTVTKPVEGVSLNISEATLEIGENLTLTASVYPYDATDTNVVWSSSNTEAAVVDQSGNITAVGSGTAVISATSNDGGYTAECAITVVTKPVEGVSLNISEATLKIGENLALTASVYPYDATDTNVVWSSSNTEAAVVDQSGNITAVGSGTAVISATSNDGGYTAECTVTVTKPVESVSLNMSETTLEIGENLALTASVNPIDASDTSIVWSSDNSAVAKVDQSGNVNAIANGTAIITAKTVDGNFTANCTITVIKPVTGVSIDKSQVTIDYGASTTLTAAVAPVDASNNGISWSSSNTSVAIVDESGKVTGVGAGSAIITVTTVDGGFKAACEVTVNKPAISVTLNKTTATINKDTTLQLTAKILPEILPNKSVTWSSSNTSVATVDANGLVKALKPGTAVITVKTVDGDKTAQCTVTVTANFVINKIRYGGTTRSGTAVQVSKAGWTTSENVVLVNAYGFADALTGVPLAHVKNAPILLTDPDSLTDDTKDEILRLKAKNIYILGGTEVVSKGIEDNLKSRGYNVYRIAGSERFETAMAIGNQVIEAGGSKTAVLTTADNYPDALAISSYAAINKIPILYTDPAKFTESTKTFIIKNGITKVIIPGGTGAVSSAIEKDLKSRGITVQRIAGADRYSTAYNIVNTFKSSFKNDVMIATGANFPDALSGGALAAKMQIPILLVQQNSIDADSAAFIRSKGNVNLYILGGSSVIADSIIK